MEHDGSAATQSRAESLAERNRELFERSSAGAPRVRTPEVFFTKHIDNSRLVKADDPERAPRDAHVHRRDERPVRAGDGLCAGSTSPRSRVGYHVEAQKQQVEQLREENRQLRLVGGAAHRPGAHRHAWRKQLGLDAPQPGQVVRAGRQRST